MCCTGLIHRKRCCRCILQPQLTGLDGFVSYSGMDILVYIYIYIYQLVSVIARGVYWFTAHFFFVCQLDTSWDSWAGKCCYNYCLFCTLEQWFQQKYGKNILIRCQNNENLLWKYWWKIWSRKQIAWNLDTVIDGNERVHIQKKKVCCGMQTDHYNCVCIRHYFSEFSA